MQIFIKRSDLTRGGGQPIPIVASYDDGIAVDRNWHADTVCMIVPTSAITTSFGLSELKAGWQEMNKQQIVSSEATRRINQAFPEYSQRNAIAEIESYILQYGADFQKWPQSAKERKAEFDRCWSYVSAVRAVANTMPAKPMPANPSADANWPTRIAPYKTS